MAKAKGKPKDAGTNASHDAVVCEPGRHINCLHAKMAAKRSK